jgi:hypothetical protein
VPKVSELNIEAFDHEQDDPVDDAAVLDDAELV